MILNLPVGASDSKTKPAGASNSKTKPVGASGWDAFASSMVRAANATGRGLATAARLAQENRHYVLPVLNGFVGDQLAREVPDAAIRMSFRKSGRDVSLAELDLPPHRIGHGRTVVVMLPGLMCDEVIFHDTRWLSSTPPRPGLGERISQEVGAEVLYLRYNTGRHISENGRALSALLQELVDTHGEDIDQLVLLGHSMGGLVIRSAGHYAPQLGHSWVDKLSTVLLVGVPLKGSFVEQLANLTAFVLARVGNLYTTLGAWILQERSDGIKDLRFGLMVDEDWTDHPLDERLFATKTPVPPLPNVRYHVIAGTLPKDGDSALSGLFGDGLVRPGSAAGDALFGPDDPDHPCGTVRFFPGRGHLDLLADPEVGDHVLGLVRQAASPGADGS